MKKQLILAGSMFLLVTFSNFQCSTECNDALCDLTTELVITGSTVITAGVPFNIPNLIKNVADATIECLTGSAGESESRIKVDYDANANLSFSENKIDGPFNVPSINAGEQAIEKYSFSFNTPGQYRIITFADDPNQIKERSDNNNSSVPNIVPAGRLGEPAKQALIITVLPNPNYTKPPNVPDVVLNSRTVTVIPQ
jgi:hypothetical protein